MEHWLQNYDPLQNAFLSTIVAALPVVVLLTAIAFFHLRIHLSALLGLAVVLLSDQRRQRFKHFLSRHVYRVRHDYRQGWMTFNERATSVVDVTFPLAS